MPTSEARINYRDIASQVSFSARPEHRGALDEYHGGGEPCAGFADESEEQRSLQSLLPLGPVRSPAYLRYSIDEWYVGGVEWSEKRCRLDKGSELYQKLRGSVAEHRGRTQLCELRVTWRSKRRIISRVVCRKLDERSQPMDCDWDGRDQLLQMAGEYTVVIRPSQRPKSGRERSARPNAAAKSQALGLKSRFSKRSACHVGAVHNCVGKKAPQARVIFDRFHIVNASERGRG